MRQSWSLNDNWDFERLDLTVDEAIASIQAIGKPQGEAVRLPHTVAETPLNYFTETAYEGLWCYSRWLEIPEHQVEEQLFLSFEGAGHHARVFLDGAFIGEHLGGYTAFELPLVNVRPGGRHLLAVLLDSREQLDCPPFGHVVDYMTYGGLYREVWLKSKPRQCIEDFYLWGSELLTQAPRLNLQLTHQMTCEAASGQLILEVTLEVHDAEATAATASKAGTESLNWQLALPMSGITHALPLPPLSEGHWQLWSLETPKRYQATLRIWHSENLDGAKSNDAGLPGKKLLDQVSVVIGLREAVFKEDGFYLNGERVQLVGANRHQSYPYVGYAMPAGPQRLDAHILKRELGMNAVRTAHYPQSHHFIEACDAIGLLVFTELPGWQHIGGEAWQSTAVVMVDEMVTQYRHHPSIILWGVRINESLDNTTLYRATNDRARQLDPMRQTGGVRYLRNSELLEDVYTFNDFSYNGIRAGQPGILPRKKVTKGRGGYLVSEYNGHMFPTKSYDNIRLRTEHALRHAHVLSSIQQEVNVAGGFCWCLFDYNTHKDFGSGDGICHHGIMDMFRNPKLAAGVYASQRPLSEGLALRVGSELHIGDYPAGYLEPVYVFTNAQAIRLYKNGRLVGTYTREDTKDSTKDSYGDKDYSGLKNPPIILEDLVGDALEKGEGYSPGKARRIKALLRAGARYGTDHLPMWALALAARLVLLDGFKPSDGMRLYGKYVGNWGDAHSSYTFEAVEGDRVLGQCTLGGASEPRLEIRVDRTNLVEADTYDMACVRFMSVDGGGNPLPYDMEVVEMDVEGPIEIIGPKQIALRGGMGGTYVRTAGRTGTGRLTLKRGGKYQGALTFDICIQEGEAIR